MVYLDSLGWPVVRVRGQWFFNFLRVILRTRGIISRAEWQRREEERVSG